MLLETTQFERTHLSDPTGNGSRVTEYNRLRPSFADSTEVPAPVAQRPLVPAPEPSFAETSSSDKPVAGRWSAPLAALLPDEYLRQVNEQRVRLAHKSFGEPLTPAEQSDLDMAEWTMQQVRRAQFAPALEALSKRAETYRSFAAEVRELVNVLKPSKAR
jgi:hypothetical protein